MASRCLLIQVVACNTTEAMRQAYLAADPRADVVELRFDLVRDLRPDLLLALRGKPKLITVRSRRQGGGARPADRAPLLRKALAAGVSYVDLEFGDQDLPLLRGPGRTRRILSHHDFEGTPADLQALHGDMRKAAPKTLLKIVTLADTSSDVLRIRDLLKSAPRGSLAAFCMGPKGLVSRILARSWGSAAIYAPRRGDAESAPGQIPLEDLFDRFRFDRISPSTRLLGVLGSPIGHSLSPRVHNAALAALRIDACYLPFEAATVAEFLPVLSELRLSGLSVTLPHKEAILPHLDGLDEPSRSIGAVNTVIKVWNRLEGRNTDVQAAMAPLRRRLRLRGARVAILGAGGAARALAYGLVDAQARVTIFNRTHARGRELARRFKVQCLPWRRLRGFPCDLLVNTTSVGLAPEEGRTPVPSDWIAAPVVCDIIYNPFETRLLKEARARGRQVIPGLEMFLGQAAAQFEMFTGRKTPLDVMRRAAFAELKAKPVPREVARRPGRRSRGPRTPRSTRRR